MDDRRDTRGGAYDPVNRAGRPQADQPAEQRTEHQDRQWGADVRPEPLPPEEGRPLPEGLRRERKGPLMQEKSEKKERTRATDDEPTDGEMAQKHREEMQQQEKAEGEKRR